VTLLLHWVFTQQIVARCYINALNVNLLGSDSTIPLCASANVAGQTNQRRAALALETAKRGEAGVDRAVVVFFRQLSLYPCCTAGDSAFLLG